MTLGRKILLRNLALLVGLLCVGIASLVGMLALYGRVNDAIAEYSEHRLLDRIAQSAQQAKALLSRQPEDRAAVEAHLEHMDQDLRRFVELQSSLTEGSAAHEALERQDAQAALQGLQVLRQNVHATDRASISATDRARHLARLDDIARRFDHLAAEADHLVESTQHRAGRASRNALVTIGVLFGLIVLGSVVISIAQYRSIVLPLRRLRDGVRAIAAGQFDRRLPGQGEPEFAELARDFNRMASELDGLYRDLEAKVARKSRELVRSERLAGVGFLAAGVAHEISNPLGIMTGFAELSLKRLRGGENTPGVADAQRTLRIVRDEAFRCKEIIGKLLSLSKPGGGERGPVSLARVAEDVASMVAVHEGYRDRHLRLQVSGEDDLTVSGDAVEMKQVLLNLTLNALEAVTPGTGEVRIEARRGDGHVELTVSDNGAGMTPQVRQHVFEPFFTTRQHADQRGLGLGLSITHAIVTGHHGTIEAASDGPGRGSRFTVRLPAYGAGGRA